MRNNMKNYLFCFAIGICTGYLLSVMLTPSKDIKHRVNTTTNMTASSANFEVVNKEEIAKKTKTVMAVKDLSSKEKLNPSTTIYSQVNSLANDEYVKEINDLKKKNKALQGKYQRTNNRMMELTLELESLDESEITDQQMIALKDDDFAKYRRQFRGEQRDNIFDLHKDQDDLDWGFEMATQLRDFIETHYHANSVVVQGLTCKVNRCELLILEREEGIWSLVSKELTQQTWWKFSSMHSSSSSSDDEKKSFYLLLST